MSCQYRREISDACNWHQEQALTSTIFILYQTGPTGFLLKEEGESKNFKVFLGDTHTCSCPVFKKEKDLCKHICWTILKKFRVDRNDPLSWQLGLNEREINQILRGDTSQAIKARNKSTTVKPQSENSNLNEKNGHVEQRAIIETDVCPICQDELLAKKLPVSYCKFGCGNNVHIKCMKVWADHQKSNGESQLKCPLCREQFSTFEMLEQEYRNNSLNRVEKPDVHYGLVCRSCKSTPLVGKCYKCTQCAEFYMCQSCFNTDFHRAHSFLFREKVNQKYRPAARDHVGLIPNALAQELAQRDLVEADYELLTQMGARETSALSQIPEKVIKSWPSEKIGPSHALLSPGFQCRVCLRAFQVNQLVRKLPGCKHRFHLECIDNWLLHSHPTCPIDGLVVWDPVTAQLEKEEKQKQKRTPNEQVSKSTSQAKSSSNIGEISMGILVNYKPCSMEPSSRSPTRKTEPILPKRTQSSDSKAKTSTTKTGSAGSTKSSELRVDASRKPTVPPQILLETDLLNHRVNHRVALPNIEIRGTRLSSNAVSTCNPPLSVEGLSGELLWTRLDSNPFNVNRLIKARPYQLSRQEVGSEGASSSKNLSQLAGLNASLGAPTSEE